MISFHSVKWYHITSRVSFLFTALSHWYPHIIFNNNNYCCGKYLFFLSYSQTCHENSLEIFLYDAPSTPGKLSKLILLPNGKFDPFHGGGMNIFWNHTMIVWFLMLVFYQKWHTVNYKPSSWCQVIVAVLQSFHAISIEHNFIPSTRNGFGSLPEILLRFVNNIIATWQ